MLPLAHDIDGDVFDVPAAATGWRVKRLRGKKGAPEVMYRPDGRPLILPLESTAEELRRHVIVAGKYRLDPVDNDLRTFKESESGYVVLGSESATPTADSEPGVAPNMYSVLMEALRQIALLGRQNADMACTVIEKSPAMLQSAAELLRAADGAGLPDRKAHPLLIARQDDDDDDDDDDNTHEGEADAAAGAPMATPGPFGLDMGAITKALLAQLTPLITGLVSGQIKIDQLFDRRRASTVAAGDVRHTTATEHEAPSGQRSPRAEEPIEAPTETEPAAAPPTLSLQALAHFAAIQQALTPAEAAHAREAASSMTPGNRRAWIEELTALSVADAAARIRAAIAKATPEES